MYKYIYSASLMLSIQLVAQNQYQIATKVIYKNEKDAFSFCNTRVVPKFISISLKYLTSIWNSLQI